MAANKKKSKLKAVLAWLHLWLGLVSGIIVVIVSITGCILAFEVEIKELTQPYLFVQSVKDGSSYKAASELIAIAEKQLKSTPSKNVTGISFPGNGRSVVVSSFTRKPRSFSQVFLHPYTGEVLHVNKGKGPDFFRFILDGHFNLWLPRDIGQPIVSYATVMFVVILITGLVLWWPKNLKKSNTDKSFKVKWSAKFKRVNYDLHNVLGFYAMVFALLIALTGMTFGLHWFTDGLYWTFSGGKSHERMETPKSDTTLINNQPTAVLDKIVAKHFQQKAENDALNINLPDKASGIYNVNVNHRPGTFYNTDNYYYDQSTGREFKGKELFNGHVADVRLARQIHLYSYDIHVGSILGFPGKVLAFLASLVSASLPITGFIIWWGKKNKKKKTVNLVSVGDDKKQKQPKVFIPKHKQQVALQEVSSTANFQSTTKL